MNEMTKKRRTCRFCAFRDSFTCRVSAGLSTDQKTCAAPPNRVVTPDYPADDCFYYVEKTAATRYAYRISSQILEDAIPQWFHKLPENPLPEELGETHPACAYISTVLSTIVKELARRGETTKRREAEQPTDGSARINRYLKGSK